MEPWMTGALAGLSVGMVAALQALFPRAMWRAGAILVVGFGTWWFWVWAIASIWIHEAIGRVDEPIILAHIAVYVLAVWVRRDRVRAHMDRFIETHQ